MKHVLVVLLVLLFMVSLANAAEPIKIGLSVSLSGKYAAISDLQIKAFKMWEKHVNKSGGIIGREVKLISYDDKSDIKTAQSVYEKLITKDKVDLVFAPYSSELTEAIAPITENYGYPVLASGASADKIWQKGYKYIFGIYSPASKYAVGFLELLVKNNFKTIAIISADDSFSKNIADGTKQWAEKFKLKVVLLSEFKKGTKDFNSIIKNVKESNAQVLLVCGHLDESVNVRLALKEMKWSPKVYYASVGPALQAYYEKLGADANYTFSSSIWEPHEKLIGPREFYTNFKLTYGQEPSYQAAAAYAAGEILEKAIKKVGSLDKNKLKDMFYTMDTPSILGMYAVDKAGTSIKHVPVIVQWQDGKKVIVYPDELATKKSIFK